MRRILVLCLWMVIAFTGCASYTSRVAPVPKPEAMPALQTEATLTVGADPYVEKDRQQAAFDADLYGGGVLPIQVFIQNRGDWPLQVRWENITLTLPDGNQISPLAASEVASSFESRFWTYLDQHGNFLPGLIGLIPTTALNLGILTAKREQAARVADYTSKELSDMTLRKDESVHGFVFFMPPPGTQAFNEATLTVLVLDADQTMSFVIRLPLKRLAFKGVPDEGR